MINSETFFGVKTVRNIDEHDKNSIYLHAIWRRA